jgi:hypothetical protein
MGDYRPKGGRISTTLWTKFNHFVDEFRPLSIVGAIYPRLRGIGGSQQHQVPFWSQRSTMILWYCRVVFEPMRGSHQYHIRPQCLADMAGGNPAIS